MGGVSFLITGKMQETVNTQIDRVLGTNLEFVAKDIVKTNADIRRTAEIIARNRAIRKSLNLGVSRGINQILNELLRIYPFFNFVVIAEPNGDIFAVSTRDGDGHKVGGERLLGLNIKQNPMIKENLGIMEKHKDFAAGSARVAYGRPGRDPYLEAMGMKRGDSQWFVAPVHVRGGLIGWVVLSYDWGDEMSALLKNISKHLVDIGNPTIETILINSDGQVVAGNDVTHQKFEPVPSMLWKSRRVMIGNAPMNLVIVNDRKKTNEPLAEARNLLLIIVLLSSIALIVILYLPLRQMLLRRLQTLHEGTIQLGEGNLMTRLPVLGSDEIGNLASAFNRMANWLQSTTVSRDYMDNVLESITDGIITIDDKGLISTYNNAARKIFGYAGDEVIGRNVSILMPQSERRDHEAYTANSRIHARRIISRSRDLEGRRKDGSLFPMELIVTPMNVGGKRGFVGTLRDITERREVDRLKSEFVSTVSHELRTPLTSIKGSLGMISAGALGAVPDKVKGMMEIAHKNTERLVNLVNDILDMEKLESGSLEFHFDRVDLTDLVKQSLEDNKGYAREHDVDFELMAAIPGAMVMADAGRITQVIANLLSNAAKFSKRGGKVEVSVANHGDRLRVSVTDRGAGIPPSFRDKIFGKFAQADSSDSRQKGGTGLGLNISKSIVEKHGGRMGFETETGVGTTFHFDLPVLVARYDVAEAATRAATDRGLRALICEDDRDVAKVLSAMLENDGFSVDQAYSAKEAKDRLAAEKFDVMTVDIMLPDQDGLSLIREVREKEQNKNLAMVVVSAKAKQARREALETHLGIVDWLEKPINQDRLVSAVHRAIQVKTDGQAKVLYVEDDEDLVGVTSAMLEGMVKIIPVSTLSEAKEKLRTDRFDLVLIDVGLPDGSGLDLLELVKGNGQRLTPVIIFSGQEVSAQVAGKVEAVLLKSRTSNEKLVETIKSLIPAPA